MRRSADGDTADSGESIDGDTHAEPPVGPRHGGRGTPGFAWRGAGCCVMAGHRLCRISHDALDAVIAALTVRAAALRLALRPDPELQPQANREGWIALPTAPLAELAEEPA